MVGIFKMAEGQEFPEQNNMIVIDPLGPTDSEPPMEQADNSINEENARLTVVDDEVLHGGHGEGEDEMREPVLGVGGSGTLPARAGGDDTAAPSSASGLRTGATAGTYVGKWKVK
jgi:hypothetical protein